MATLTTSPKQRRNGPVGRLALHGTATATFCLVSPQDAEAYLARLAPNRLPSAALVREYASRKRLGAWGDYQHDALVLDPDGKVWNGQHRLLAMVQTQISCIMLIVEYHDWEVFNRLKLTIDHNKARTTRDTLTIGLETHVTSNQAACARSLRFGIVSAVGKIPDLEFIAFYRTNQTAIEAACRLLNKHRKYLTVAPVAAALAAALRTRDAERVARFAHVLLTGESLAVAEHGIISLRNWLMSRESGGGGTISAEIYARTTQCLFDFLAGRIPGRITPAKSELFPPQRPSARERATGSDMSQ
jgi:hypothetical protein